LRARNFLDRRNYIRVCTAAADRAAHQLPNVIRCLEQVLVVEADGETDLARSAVSALKSVVIQKGLLHRMELFTGAQSFYRRNLLSVAHNGER
jgi:hypothetical protein